MAAVVRPALVETAEGLGARFVYETPVIQLIQDADGSVKGVVAKTADGAYIKALATKGVVLTTGGYENSWEMLRENIRESDLAIGSWGFSIQNTGDGHKMGMAAGGVMDEYPHVIMRDPGGAVRTHNPGITGILGMSWPRVNESGRRFVNECLSVNFKVNQISLQPGAHCWCIFVGADPVEAFSNTDYRDDPSAVATWEPDYIVGLIQDDIQAFDTLEEMVAACDIDETGLKASVEELHAIAETGEDPAWGAGGMFKFDWTTGPYYAIEEAASALATVSGLHVNTNSAVIDKHGAPIAGLYAVGNVSGGMFAGTYPHELSGISHGRCLTFGYLLGRHLAE